MFLRSVWDHSYRFGKNIRPQIVVIGKEPKDEKEKMDNEVQKVGFERLFGTVNYIDCGFKRYVDDLH